MLLDLSKYDGLPTELVISAPESVKRAIANLPRILAELRRMRRAYEAAQRVARADAICELPNENEGLR